MKRSSLRNAIVWGWLACLGTLRLPAAPVADQVIWHARDGKLDVKVESAPLTNFLSRLSAATGWQIFVEPGADFPVEARFKNATVGDALRRTLGNLNYALLPTTNGASKLFVFQTSLHDATQLIGPAADRTRLPTGAIPKELIVTLKPGAKETIEELARRLGAKILGRIEGLHAYRLQFADDAAAQAARTALAADPEVSGVDYNFNIDRPERAQAVAVSSAAPFSLKAKSPVPGAGIVVGLVDTAVHPQAAGIGDFMLPALSVAGAADAPVNGPSHGDAMAETILKAANDGTIRLLSVDVYGNNPTTTSFEVASGIYALSQSDHPPSIYNLSLGGAGDSQFLHDLINQIHAAGAIFVGAAGNEPTGLPVEPAAFDSVIATTAGDKQGRLASYANYAGFVDVVAPGTSLIYFGDAAYLVTGTSASTAYVSGLAAGIAAQTGKPLAEVEAMVRKALAVNANTAASRKP